LTAGRTLLATAHLPQKYWSYAFYAAIFQHNCIPKTNLSTSPYTFFYDMKPPLDRLRIFGCPGVSHIPNENRRALDMSGIPVRMLGYSPTSFEYIVQRQRKPFKIFTARDVTFFEEKFLQDLDFRQKRDVVSRYEAPQLDEEDTEKDIITEHPTLTPTTTLPDLVPTPVDPEPSLGQTVEENTPMLVESSSVSCPSSSTDNVQNFCDISSDNILTDQNTRSTRRTIYHALCALKRLLLSNPLYCCIAKKGRLDHKGYNSYKTALLSGDSADWKAAYAAEITKLEDVGGLKVVPCPPKVKLLPFLEVLTKKFDPVTKDLKFKVRLAARGDLLDTTDDTYSPVPGVVEQRIFLAFMFGLSYYFRQGDISSAYLHARLCEPIYFKLPQGHPQAHDKTLCYLSNSAVYGLPQAGRAWYLHFTTYLRKLGFVECSTVKGCLISRKFSAPIYLLLYVDDFLYGSSCPEALDSFEKILLETYKAKFTDSVGEFVGMSIQQTGNLLRISQTKKIINLSKQYEIEEQELPLTPMIENLKWSSDSTRLEDIRNQQVLLGELSYINQISRPDISVAINKISRTTQKATKESYRALKRVLKFLVGSKEKQLIFTRWKNKEKSLNITIYSDSSFADIEEDKYKSTGGYLIYINENLVAWKCSKIKWVSTSTCVSEFLAMYLAVKEGLRIAYFIEEMFEINPWPIEVFGDNKSAIQIINGTTGATATKYLATKFYLLQQLSEEGKIKVRYIKTDENKSDGLTKPLGIKKFLKLSEYCFRSNYFFGEKTGNVSVSDQGMVDVYEENGKRYSCVNQKDA